MSSKLATAALSGLKPGSATTGALSMMVTELFLELHSFTLELGAFAVMWYALETGRKRLGRHAK